MVADSGWRLAVRVSAISAKVEAAFQLAGGSPGWQVAVFKALKGRPETG